MIYDAQHSGPKLWAMPRRLTALWSAVAAAALLAHGPALSQPAPSAPRPASQTRTGEPVQIEAADRILRERAPATRPPAAVRLETQRPAIAAAVNCIAGPSQPVEIITLAASLKCDPDLIFEYVYNNIEYEPLFGSNKGALGTLLDLRGNDIDQAQLFAALLSAAGLSSSYQYGYIRLNGVQASSWLGVKNDGQAINSLLLNGGIPVTNFFSGVDGTLTSIDVAHVWVRVNLGGTNYVFDPSFKQHVVSAGITNLGSVLGYTQSQFLGDAGGTVDSISISNLNRSKARADLVAYSNNLVGYIRGNNPAWTANDLVGGKTINYLTGSPVRQTTLPYLSPSQPSGFPQNWGAAVPNAYRTCFTIDMPGVTPTSCASPSAQTVLLYADQSYGQRITVSSVPSGSNFVPTLLIDGAPPPNGQNTGTALPAGQSWTVNVAITHPYTGSLAAGANQSAGLTIRSGGSYLIGAGWGQVGRGMVEKHRTMLAEAHAAGNAGDSEVVVGESLAVISYSWLAETAGEQRLADGIGQLTTQYHHGVGIAGQTAIQDQSGTQGPFIDTAMNFATFQPQTNYTGGAIPPTVLGAFFTLSGTSSSLESAVLEQTQALIPGMQAASTIRLVDINAASGAKTYFADGTTAAGVQTYFNSIRSNLVSSYAATDLDDIDQYVSTNGQSTGSPTGNRLLLPANGNIAIGLWSGAGYTVTAQSGGGSSYSIEATQKISGGLSGGFSGTNVPTTAPAGSPTLSSSTQTEMAPASGDPSIPAGATAAPPAPGNPTAVDPVDAITGAYLYRRTDLTTGGGQFPYALPFARVYTSSANLAEQGLGRGWAQSYAIRAARNSDPYAAMGESSAIAAAPAIAALYVLQDLLSGPQDGQHLTVAWVVARWLTDQLTNNAVLVSWPGSSEQFTWLPHADGSANVTYNPPLGSAVALTGSAPDPYGDYTSFVYTNKDQSRISFNPVGSAANGQIAGWGFPNGMNVAFGYDGAGQLSNVTNNLGRNLSLGYAGGHVVSVTDDTGRSAAYSYAGADLSSYADPLGFSTRFAYDGAGRLTQAFYPSNPVLPFFTNAYDGLGRVAQQANASGNASSFYIAGSRTEIVDAAGDRHVTYQTPRGRVIKDASVLSPGFGNVFNDTAQQNNIVNVAANRYDGQDRLILATAPEGGTVAYTWSPDLLQNLTQVTRTAKPGSPLSPLATTFAYDPILNKPTRITDPRGLVTTMGYDPATGNMVSLVADAAGLKAKSRFTYNGFGQVLTATDPLGAVTQYAYDGFGNPVSVTRDSGRLNQLTRMGYNAAGDVTSVTDPNGDVTASTYDAARRLTGVSTPPTGSAAGPVTTAFTYDPDGRLVQTRQSAAATVLRTTAASYTATGKLATATDANGNVTRYAYDIADRLAKLTDPVGRATTYGYDALSRLTQILNTAIQAAPLEQRGYTPDGLLASLTDANAHATSFAYDRFDRLATTTYPLGSTEVLSYDADGNVLTRKTRKGDTITFTYDTLNRLKTKTPPSPAPVVTYSYDFAGRLTAVSDTSAAVTKAVPPSGSTVQYGATYTYDALNRPINVSWTPVPTQATPAASTVTFNHSYDQTNRRIGQTATDNSWWRYPTGPATVNYTANALNQYSAVNAVTPTHDGNGNLTFDGTFTYAYDAESRLTSVKQGATTVASYAYDAQGRRKSKTAGGTTTVFVTDADNRQVLEYDGTSGAVQRWYAFGLGPDEVLNQMNVPSSTRATMIPDIQGSIIGTLDSATAALTKTGYQPYGENPANLTGTFRYTARRLDSETGGSAAQPSGLYYYRARTYSPTWGRFLQPDPIGYAAGNNLYAYVGNDPLNNTDPFGYQAIPGLVIGGVSGGVAGYIAGGWQGALIGGGAGAVVGIGAPSLSMAAARIAVAYTGSSTAGFSTGAATFSVLNAGAGALATVGTNVVEGLPTFGGVGVGALLGAAAPLLSGEAILVGAGGGVAAGLSELADFALSAQSGIFGTIGTVLISPPGQMK